MKDRVRSMWRVILGGFGGGYIGRAIVLGFQPELTWLGLLVGLLVGGLVGWLLPNVGQAIWAFRHSWRYTVGLKQ